MEAEINNQYKYRRWPLFLFAYTVFAIFYFFFVYSFSELSYRAIAETAVMTIFVITSPLLVYFHLKIVKIKKYSSLGLDILYSWLISTLVIFMLLFSYVDGWNWFGAIALLFFLFCYNLLWLVCSYIFFRIKKRRIKKVDKI